MKKSEVLKFSDGFSYPFGNAKRMWNVLWLLLPIFGWFALGGYSVRIVGEWTKGKFKGLPEMKFVDDMKLGVIMFVKAIPFIVCYMVIVGVVGEVDFIGSLVNLFVVPVLSINFVVKRTVASYFEFKVLDSVFANFWDYVVSMLKCFVLGVIYLVLVIVLVGIPGSLFTKNIFIADFYRRRVE
jgi:hypothetical protein